MKNASLLGVLTCAALSSAPARGDGTLSPPEVAAGAGRVDTARCVDAVAKGQRLRADHKLVEAREELRVCARIECPAVMRSDCATWLAEIDTTLPTVVLSAKDGAGRDAIDVKVSVDGAPLAGTLDGGALALDPGLRTFRFERADGSTATAQVLVKEGDKARSVAVVLAVPNALVGSAEAGGGGPPAKGILPEPAPSTSGSALRWAGLLMGGVGVIGMGVGAAVAFDAKAKDNRAAGELGPSRQTDSGSAVSEGNAATVVLGVGAALAATGVVLWLTAPSEKLTVGTDGRGVIFRGGF
jgi:hypothetical protein